MYDVRLCVYAHVNVCVNVCNVCSPRGGGFKPPKPPPPPPRRSATGLLLGDFSDDNYANGKYHMCFNFDAFSVIIDVCVCVCVCVCPC